MALSAPGLEGRLLPCGASEPWATAARPALDLDAATWRTALPESPAPIFTLEFVAEPETLGVYVNDPTSPLSPDQWIVVRDNL